MKRTMYQAARHTPKRNAPGSNPGKDANAAEVFSFSGFVLKRRAAFSILHKSYNLLVVFLPGMGYNDFVRTE